MVATVVYLLDMEAAEVVVAVAMYLLAEEMIEYFL